MPNYVLKHGGEGSGWPGNSAKCFWELKCFYGKISAKQGVTLD